MECPRCGENFRSSKVTKHPDRNDIDVRSCGACGMVVEYISRSVREYAYDDFEKPKYMGQAPARKYEPVHRYNDER
jgi:transcription elongation factor Elf1